MQPYIKEKQKKKKRIILKIKIYSYITFFFLLAIGISYVVIYSPVFQIQKINKKVLSGDIKNFDKIISDLGLFFATRSKLASILGPNNILVWKNNAEDFLRFQPTISDLTIKKDYSKRIVEISIGEMQKFGIICSAIECWWFNKKGIIFEKAPNLEGEIILKINDLSNRKLKIGEMILAKNIFDNVIKIFEVLERIGLNIKTLNIDDLTLEEAYIQSLSTPKIYFSLRFPPDLNPAVYSKLLEIGLEKIEYIDLRVKNRIYYKMK